MKDEIEVLRQELKLVAENAPSGSHKKVAEKVKYSEMYIQQIRKGITLTNDTPDNIKLLKDCIKAYRTLINKEITKLSKL